ncbi:CPBP family intramembrane metalloprotease [Staphylococcus sp. SQ8-PEA]|uniref:CPBP family intramembrane metalloprotease n=1 Tax=Staphylococcus marylandisciuri TaxID=2981529 RepID=A0ABT2QMX7_9STAP|nr:CPBP family intramembrane glutamic endopeptidase [Staphylococcus marylandisciuri]MCU5745316.1 CPBP family intramembrane metalloprotease [Staphylococcus marylandisciuri]
MFKTKKHKAPSKIYSFWQASSMVKRDYWLIPLYFIVPAIVELVIKLLFSIFIPEFNQSGEDSIVSNTASLIADTLGLLLILLVFYLMHRRHHLLKVARQRFKAVRYYIFLIVVTYIITILLETGYDWLTQFLPKSLQFNETQNEESVNQLFHVGWLMPITVINVAIITPFVEELIFRHLIIHELGKKITYQVAAALSVFLFTSVHVIGATSPFEFGSYLFIAIGIVFVYMKSERNLAVSITFHMLCNLIASIANIVNGS